jgi:hypothetical protein
MERNKKLKKQWDTLIKKLSDQFADGENLDLDGVLYLIGVQELGQIHRKYKKDEKINLMHIAICRVLEPYGYYKFDFYDGQGWPHYQIKEKLPSLKAGEQSILMKEAAVNYFIEAEFIT